MPDQDDFLDSDTLTGAGSSLPAPPRKANEPEAPKHVVFPPGTTIAGRYRIATLLGEGGMGEVYRADDLTLNQAVALKFLPRKLSDDPAALARFHGEVRTARQIAHSSVCRVFDIGEAEGRLFLTMEYIDGEDLASLLRRIGRLPHDKALELARQICAGVAAAHEAGVLHRDLKPANIMIDGRGRAHVTDFGVAGLAADLRSDMSRAGTPAYMAPEQLAGKGVTEQSDIFSLGLILYEMFTGKRAFEAANVHDLMSIHDSAPSRPSTLIGDIDPLAERIILRCLERDPAQRPKSALDVARGLPGGDPLAAALAAGETPSPEMVAASGGEGAIAPRTAWMLLGGFAAILATIFVVAPYSQDVSFSPVDKTPEMLAERAAAVVKKAGYSDSPADTNYTLYHNVDFLTYRASHQPKGEDARDLAHAAQPAYLFAYRQSPRPLIARASTQYVSLSDPPFEIANMVNVILTSRGDLTSFQALPPQAIKAESWIAQYPTVDWNQWMVEAGLDPARFEKEEPIWAPLMAFDSRAGFRGSYAANPKDAIHVMAYSFQGKPVYFSVTGPWSHANRDTATVAASAFNVAQKIFIVIQMAIVALAVFLAYRNWKLGRGDLKGTIRLGSVITLSQFAALLCVMHFVPDPAQEWSVVLELMSKALFAGILSMLGYVAIEPFLRRTWPQVLTSWARLVSGAVHDPLIGRDLLAGALLGAIDALLVHLKFAGGVLFHVAGQTGMPSDLGSSRLFAAGLFFQGNNAAQSALFPMLLLFVLRITTKRMWLTQTIGVLIFSVIAFSTGDPILSGIYALISASIMVYTGTRLGLVALAAYQSIANLLAAYALVLDPSRWYFPRAMIVVSLAVALAIYGFRTSLGGKSAFGALSLDAES